MGKNPQTKVQLLKELEEAYAHIEKLEKIKTEYLKMEVTLRLLQDMFLKAFHASPIGIAICRLEDGCYVDVNESLLNMMGFEREEMIGKTSQWLGVWLEPDNREGVIKKLTAAGSLRDMEATFQTKSGAARYVILSMEIIELNGEQCILCLNHDITERRLFEAELRETEENLAAEKERLELLKMQKLESVGVLAGGIAHDFNNILAGILANAQLAKIKLEKGMDVSRCLTGIEEATIRATNLTKQLLTFSKGGVPIKKTTQISEVIQDTVDFGLRGTSARCNIKIPGDLWPVEVDEGQISQVINNLIINANQAMPNGGTIEVKVENVTVSNIDVTTVQAGKYIKVSIKDQGIGIPQENLTKIFDPYFTTKQTGSGLGLTTSYYIVKRHNGYLDVESKVGEGSTFRIFLPVSEGKIAAVGREAKLPLQGKGTILLMDDEEMIRNITGEMLEAIGYKVLLVKDGAEAIMVFKQVMVSGGFFDAVIMDLTIPGAMGGKETIPKLIQMDPKVKVIVSSGYFNDPVMSNYRDYGFSEVVAKPYKIEELNAKLCKLITKG